MTWLVHWLVGVARALGRTLVLLTLVTALALGTSGTALAAPVEAQGAAQGAQPEFDVAVVEHLRVKVPAEARQAWLSAERQSWEPWLRQQAGFVGRELLWDNASEEGTLLIRWASREQWKAIPQAEIEAVQQRFEQLAKAATGSADNPFPLVFEGELLPS